MSEQRLYTSAEMVRLPGEDCAGCGKCCRGMGDTILLDPWDIAQLTNGLKKTFQEMLDHEIELHADEGIIVPHLKMQAETDACAFLGEDGKCRIHTFRPGICRLFPLGRQFGDKGVRYFLVPEAECPASGRTKERADRWLGIPGGSAGLKQYEAYKEKWHAFVRRMKDVLSDSGMEEGTAGQINVYLLQQFFVRPYERDSFYEAFEERLKRVEGMFFE